jgi:hypothetical protein
MPAVGDEVLMQRDCGSGSESEAPILIPGSILLGSDQPFFCGWVVDPDGFEIPGATVELWQTFPTDGPNRTTMSSGIGSFAFDSVEQSQPFDLYAYKDGYYPGSLDDVTFDQKGAKIVLTPVDAPVATSEFVFYYCGDNSYLGVPLPAGSVVEARVTNDIVTDYLVGQWFVHTAGEYGNMPVYRANEGFGDLGAKTGNTIEFFVNGMPAIASGDVSYPAENFVEVMVCLEAGTTVSKECELAEGWNLISWKVANSDTDILEIFGPYMDNIEVIVGFEQGGLIYDPALEQFSTLWNVDHVSGYWVKATVGFTFAVEGAPLAAMPGIAVTTGWNLVSYLPEDVLTPTEALNSLQSAGILLYAYGFNGSGIQIYEPGAGAANTLEEMASCNGYWVKTDDNGTLVYPADGGPVASPGIIAGARGASSAGLVAGVTTTPNLVAIYSTRLTIDGRVVDPGAVVTAHNASGDLVGKGFVRNNGEFGFMPVYAGEEVALHAGERFYLAVDGAETVEQFEWTANGDRIPVAGLTTGAYSGDLPDNYSLAQNYPNPFNPTTTVKFTMAASGSARIEVFNILGKLIATPFDGQAAAGENSVVWDGRNANGELVASGVYLYRMTAGDYTETRKMMLLK